MKTCPMCGRSVSPNAAACPGCGEPIAPARTNTQGINLRDPGHVAGVVLAVIILLGIGLYVFASIASARYDRQSAIEMIKYQNRGGAYALKNSSTSACDCTRAGIPAPRRPWPVEWSERSSRRASIPR